MQNVSTATATTANTTTTYITNANTSLLRLYIAGHPVGSFYQQKKVGRPVQKWNRRNVMRREEYKKKVNLKQILRNVQGEKVSKIGH